MKALLYLVGPCLLLVGCTEGNKPAAPPAKDNTSINERDGHGSTTTPMDQSNQQADLDLTAKIREKVLEIEGLSVNGQNVKIISVAGQVALRGPVASAAEKDQIGAIATKIAGEGHVTNELEVVAE